MSSAKQGKYREQLFGQRLRSLGIDFVYPCSFLRLPDGQKYTPDFYIPKFDYYVEVVGSRQAYHDNKDKVDYAGQIFNLIRLRPNGELPILRHPASFRVCSVCHKKISPYGKMGLCSKHSGPAIIHRIYPNWENGPYRAARVKDRS